MASTLLLETFSDGKNDANAPQHAAQLTVTYEDGFAAGLAAAEDSFSSQQDVLRRELVTAVREAICDVDAIRAEVLAAVRPLHDAILSVLLPEVIAPALHSQLRTLVAEAASEDLASPLTVLVPPGQADALEIAVADIQAAGITFQEDHTLPTNAVRVATPKRETALDLDAAMSAIGKEMTALQELTLTPHEVNTYG